MITGRNCTQASLFFGLLISACGTSQSQLDLTATQVAAEIFVDQTAQSPTPTQTFTPAPTPTVITIPTMTPSPTIDILTKETEFLDRLTTLINEDDIQEAINLCSEAIDNDPSFAMAYAMRGVFLIGTEDLEAAVLDLDKAIQLGITDDLDKEIEPGMSVKTLYYFRGIANMYIGAYVKGVEDFEFFLDITEPLEYPKQRARAQIEIGQWKAEPVPVTSQQQFDFPLYSIFAPPGDGWGVEPHQGEMSIRFGRLDLLDEGETVYSELTTIALSLVEILDEDYSSEEFLQFACAYMTHKEDDRYHVTEENCDPWEKSASECVNYQVIVEDSGGKDFSFSPPLIINGVSLSCRHPDYYNVMIFMHYSQRSPQGGLEADVAQKAEVFFDGLSFNQAED